MKRIFLFLLILFSSQLANADELLQIKPQPIKAGYDEGEEFFTIELKNDDNIYLALQFDLYLPEGVDLIPIDDVPVYLSEDRFTYKRGVCTTHEANVTKRVGFYRVQIYGKNGNVAIPDYGGPLCDIYYTSVENIDGILPIQIKNVTLGLSGTEGVYPADNISFLYKETCDLSSITSIDLTSLEGVTPFDVAEATRQLLPNPNTLLYLNEGSQADGLANVVVGEECESLVLTDGYEFFAPKPFTAAEASYSREIGSEGWYSVCLPFAGARADGGEVERFESLEGTSVTFATGEMQADKPCIFRAEEGQVEFIATDAAVAATPETLADGNFFGTYATLPAGSLTGSYTLRADGSGFGVCTEAAWATPFRGILRAESEARLLTVNHDSANGIAPAATTTGNDATYTLSGQRIANPQSRGIYIRKSKKVINK